MINWTPCDEQPPKESGYYLISLTYFNPEVSTTPLVRTAFYSAPTGEWEGILCVLNVDAWAPLPEGYRK